MTENLRSILDAVAAGQLSPQEAAERIQAGSPGSAGDPAGSPVRSLAIKATAAKLTVAADPAVPDLAVDGPHRIERDNDLLTVVTESPQPQQPAGEPPRSAFRTWLNQAVDRLDQPLTPVTVRVNPALPLDVLLAGGTLDLTGVQAPLGVGVEAGTASLADGVGPLRLDVTTGSARVDWTFTGDSAVRAEMSSVTVNVRPDSDVRVTAISRLGQAQIRAQGGQYKAPADGATAPIPVGAGTGTLQVSAHLGSAQVSLG